MICSEMSPTQCRLNTKCRRRNCTKLVICAVAEDVAPSAWFVVFDLEAVERDLA